jgi:GT2 family glycosyltransferase
MISIIIIVKNDLEIVNTIEGINRLDYLGDAELIIVDRSTITYPKVKSRLPLRWIRYDPKGKRYTIPEQRNEGVNQAKGDIIVFIDANCVPEKDWLTALVKPISEENEQIVMGRTGSIGKPTSYDVGYDKLRDTMYVQEAPTVNLAITRHVFETVGVFDESLEYGSDIDFTWRAIDKGYSIRYQPSAFVAHNWGDSKKELKRTILYGKARARLLTKHIRTRWRHLLGKDADVLVYPTLILFLPIAIVFPWYLCLFPLLVLRHMNEPNPIGIVIKHTIYGCGVLIEVKNQLFAKRIPVK